MLHHTTENVCRSRRASVFSRAFTRVCVYVCCSANLSSRIHMYVHTHTHTYAVCTRASSVAIRGAWLRRKLWQFFNGARFRVGRESLVSAILSCEFRQAYILMSAELVGIELIHISREKESARARVCDPITSLAYVTFRFIGLTCHRARRGVNQNIREISVNTRPRGKLHDAKL